MDYCESSRALCGLFCAVVKVRGNAVPGSLKIAGDRS